jgi:hypothetical protein
MKLLKMESELTVANGGDLDGLRAGLAKHRSTSV